ncbi:hypothetical protein FB451DRAFT_1376511 [Mycena latifolia]|nr:hypothetical protein FB451DRAFT_1376511 [Mycena latifolia]
MLGCTVTRSLAGGLLLLERLPLTRPRRDSREQPDVLGSTTPTCTKTRCGAQSPEDLKLRDICYLSYSVVIQSLGDAPGSRLISLQDIPQIPLLGRSPFLSRTRALGLWVVSVAHKTRARRPIESDLVVDHRNCKDGYYEVGLAFHSPRGLFSGDCIRHYTEWVTGSMGERADASAGGVSGVGEGVDSARAGKGGKQAAPARQNFLTRRGLALSRARAGREKTGGGDVLGVDARASTVWYTGKRGAVRRAEGRRRQSHGRADGRTGLGRAGGRADAARCGVQEKTHPRTTSSSSPFFLGARRARSAVSSLACSAAGCACTVTSWALVPAHCARTARRSPSTVVDDEMLDNANLDWRSVVSRSASWLCADPGAGRCLCRCVMVSGMTTATAAMKDPDAEVFPSAEQDRTRAGPTPAVETGGARPGVVRVATGGRGRVSGCGMTEDLGVPAPVDVELIAISRERLCASTTARSLSHLTMN